MQQLMSPIDYTIVIVYLVVMVLIGVWLQKKASSGIDSYFLGNRSIPWWVLGASGMSSNLDVTGTMINTAMLFALGFSGFFVEMRGGLTLALAFLMIFMGKWNRRSGAMTIAEWMQLRFGTGKAGHLARIISAIAAIILTVAMITYFCKGAGKFVAEFLGIASLMQSWGIPETISFLGLTLEVPPDFWAALIMIILAMIYTVASGLYGVVWTDVFQSVFIFATIVGVCYICITEHELPEKFQLSTPVNETKLAIHNEMHPQQQISVGSQIGENDKYTVVEIERNGKKQKFLVWETTREEWTGVTPKNRFHFPEIAEYSLFNFMGILLLFYLIKALMEGYGGLGGYMAQRYFAAASDRDAGLLSLFWTLLLSLRWPFIAAIAIMGISLGAKQGVIGDPEMVLPTVVNQLVPTGLKGFLVAGLMAAAMSTFDSTVNGGAAYWVKDIYQAYLNPEASEKQLMWHSRISSIAIVAVALICSLAIRNINEIWAWTTMGIGAGLFVPQLIRWYWWRLNGWGFAIGTGAGIIAAIVQKALLPEGSPEYVSFSIVVVVSTVATIAGTLATPPTDQECLKKFYTRTRPFGLWKPVTQSLPEQTMQEIDAENKRDIISTFVALPWQIILFLTGMMIIMKRWDQFGWLLVLTLVLSLGLYVMWFKHINNEVKVE